jgi:hypothetical protein
MSSRGAKLDTVVTGEDEQAARHQASHLPEPVGCPCACEAGTSVALDAEPILTLRVTRPKGRTDLLWLVQGAQGPHGLTRTGPSPHCRPPRFGPTASSTKPRPW